MIQVAAAEAKNPAAIKAASAGNGSPMLSRAMNTATNQTP
jgi:hypothetical protein